MNSMSSQEPLWHYTDGTAVFGPFDASAIQQLANAGMIRPDHLLAREGDDTWRPLSEVIPAIPQTAIQQPLVSSVVVTQSESKGDGGVIAFVMIIAIVAVIALFIYPPSILLLMALAFIRLIKWAWGKL